MIKVAFPKKPNHLLKKHLFFETDIKTTFLQRSMNFNLSISKFLTISHFSGFFLKKVIDKMWYRTDNLVFKKQSLLVNFAQD